jgi:hypothetical protein
MTGYDPRFDADRDARAAHRSDYDQFRKDINDPVPPDMAQLPITRGPDPIGQDVRAVLWFLIGLVALISAFTWAALS